MSDTIVQAARRAGKLSLFLDYRAGNFKDQGNNNLTVTYPSDARLSRSGLRCMSDPASVNVDLSDVMEMTVVALIAGKNRTGSDQIICELSANYTSETDCFAMWQEWSDTNFYGAIQTADGNTQAYAVNPERTDSAFVAMHFNRELSYETVKPYYRGLVDINSSTDNNVNDGSGFANNTLYFMAKSGGTLTNAGLLQVFGIIEGQLTATQQAQLYKEIRDKETM